MSLWRLPSHSPDSSTRRRNGVVQASSVGSRLRSGRAPNLERGRRWPA
jgi:hypothetical protein